MDQLQNVVNRQASGSEMRPRYLHCTTHKKADIAKIPATKTLKSRLAPFFLEDFSFFRSSSERLYRAKVCRGRHELLGALS